MSLDWKNSTCEDCRYRVLGSCRRFPPIAKDGYFPCVVYFDEKGNQKYNIACAEYKRIFTGNSKEIPKEDANMI